MHILVQGLSMATMVVSGESTAKIKATIAKAMR
jgi:hypothetical protein